MSACSTRSRLCSELGCWGKLPGLLIRAVRGAMDAGRARGSRGRNIWTHAGARCNAVCGRLQASWKGMCHAGTASCHSNLSSNGAEAKHHACGKW